MFNLHEEEVLQVNKTNKGKQIDKHANRLMVMLDFLKKKQVFYEIEKQDAIY